jgi:hypothetical protein
MPNTSVITMYRRELLCQATSGEISAVPAIVEVAFGSGGVNASGYPLVPSELQTALNNEVARYPVSSIAYPVSTTARYTAVIPANALAGVNISEAALVDAAGGLCAIKNMYAKRKDAGVSITFTFDDEF